MQEMWLCSDESSLNSQFYSYWQMMCISNIALA